MRPILALMLTLSTTATALAGGLDVDIELPRIDVADYRRPYVAVWIERPDNSVAANLSVWYDAKMRNDEGEKWLKDMRQWWRRIGRGVEVPIDGVTAATRMPGKHRLSFTTGQTPLGTLAAGEYRLVVEAAREHGGREILHLPFHWPATQPVQSSAQGRHEIGTVSLGVTP
ncbi:MAG: DUF2271 domain-containing protein [Chromatiales bacterium]|nr:DUF2271 domain-containing protein [Chromatiales bacterium]